MLGGVDRRRVTPEFVDRIGAKPDSWLSAMTNQGRVYYLSALMSLCITKPESCGVLPEAILRYLSPWPFLSAPHKWRQAVVRVHSSGPDVTEAYVRLAVRVLAHPDEFVRSGKADLVPSLSIRERKAVKLFVHLPEVSPMDPLLLYAIEETLDGRIEVGDGYSWLPRHEVAAVVSFIDFLVHDCRGMLSRNEVDSLLVRRSSLDLAYAE